MKMNKIIYIIICFALVSCGGNSNSNTAPVEDVVTTKNNSGVQFQANFESMEGQAFWTIELFDQQENSLGICEFEKRDKTDKKPVYFKNTGGDPICSGVQIDPSSTVGNLKIFNDFDLIKYCLVDNGVQKCGEVRK